jgi:hypothetical protein
MKSNTAARFLSIALLALSLTSCEKDIIGSSDLTNKPWVLFTIKTYFVYDDVVFDTSEDEFYGDELTYEFRQDGEFIIGGIPNKSDPMKYTFDKETNKILVTDKYSRTRFEYTLKTLTKEDLVLVLDEVNKTSGTGLIQDWIFKRK